MLDSDQPETMPAGADLIATYADLWSLDLADYLRGLCRQVVWIDRGNGDPGGIASVLDVEPGLFRPGQVPAWLDAKGFARTPFRTVYCDRADLAAVEADAGGRRFWRWVATLDGTAHLDGAAWQDRPAAIQCLPAAKLGFHADLSLVLRAGWNPTP
ncbi:MAG TPA: hypothetical protein VIX86_12555 [Streptosporangiaceae bacterium]